MRGMKPAVLFLPVSLVLSVLGFAQERPAGTPRAWEHESSDLAVDPRIRFGALENGLRYAWLANPEPKERCYVRLHVDVGSLAEEDSERGMAHFLEHMAFNGSEHFAADTLIEWFQENGMAFGADTNAYTSFSETVYQLDLPNSDTETLTEGFTVMRDWADGLLLEEAEVTKEKGVVDGEEVEGDSASRRVQERMLAEQYADTRYPVRLPIGERDVRAAFDAESVRGFYERWYRPENFTLIVVGDLGELDPTALIEEHFASLAVLETPVAPEPPLGKVKLEQRAFAIHEHELPQVELRLELLKLWEDEPDTTATRTDDIDLACARGMLNLRFAELVKKDGTPFLSAGVGSVGGLDIYDGEVLRVMCEPDRWQDALAAAELELRRALQFGFQEAELAEVRADWQRSLDEAVDREPTRHSGNYVNELLGAAETRYVPTNAVVDRGLVRPVLDALTVADCLQAFRKAWGEGVVNLYSTGDLDLGPEAAAKLSGALAAAREVPAEKGAKIEAATFAYSSDPERTGTLVAEEHVEDLDAWLFTFENGVRLNVKATDFQERQILVSARVAEGLLTIAPEDYAIGWVGVQIFGLAGLGAHTADDLRRLTAGKRVGVRFGWSDDAFTLSGASTAEDLLFQLEILSAVLSDPGWRDDGIRMVAERVPLIFQQLAFVSTGPLVLEFLPALFHDDARFVELPAREAITAVTMEQIQAWLAPELAKGPVEVTIVGDLDVEAVRDAAARTLGVLPTRRLTDPHTARRTVESPSAGIRMTRDVVTNDEKSFVFLAFPIGDGLESVRRRHLSFLGQVVQDRLRIEVREKLGAAYSPGADSTPNRVFPGVGLLTMQSNVDPAKVETFVEACLAVAADLAENGVTQEEVDRLKEPALAQIRDARRTNGFWLSSLSEAQSDPDALEDLRSLDAFYTGLEAAPISALAKQYLEPARASVLVVNPKPAAEEEGEAQEAGAEKED